MNMPSNLMQLRVLAFSLVLIIVPFFAGYYFWVTNQTKYFNGRNLRILAAAHVAKGELAEARAGAKALLDVQPRFLLSAYAERCPFKPSLRQRFIDHLREAGLPH